MLVDLVQTTTRDGLRLDGALLPATTAGRPPLSADGLCFVHGHGGSFYSSALFDAFAERLPELGCAVLRVNTRGHDLVSTAATARGGRRLGAAYEVVDDCRHDLAAWLDWLRGRVGPRVGLVGHSSGAVKCLYALAHEPGLSAACVVALSPPRLSYSWFSASPEGAEFREDYALAQRLVADGRPDSLVEVRHPLPGLMTAGGYVAKYGPDERHNYLRFVSAVACPMLVTFGGMEVEGNMAFRGAPLELTALAAEKPGLRVVTIAGADHFYSGLRGEVVARVIDWLRTAVP
jgi:pimeloyl-ACP methyl ester carboxylesterase